MRSVDGELWREPSNDGAPATNRLSFLLMHAIEEFPIPPDTFILIPGRTSDQGCGISEGKFQEKYQREINSLQVAPGDMARLGLKDGDRVRLTSDSWPNRSQRHQSQGRRTARGPVVHRLRRPLQPADGGRHPRLRHADQQGDRRDAGSIMNRPMGQIFGSRCSRPEPTV